MCIFMRFQKLGCVYFFIFHLILDQVQFFIYIFWGYESDFLFASRENGNGVEGDTPQTVKARLRQWAQVVACTVRQSS